MSVDPWLIAYFVFSGFMSLPGYVSVYWLLVDHREESRRARLSDGAAE